MTGLELLRRHVTAVWGVRLPALEVGDADVLPGEESLAGALHPDEVATWALYLAETAIGEVRIWRGDVATAARGRLLERGRAALALPSDVADEPGITREVALHQAAAPTLGQEAARRMARPIGRSDRAMVDAAFEPGWAAYYLDAAERMPVFGAIVAGRLLSVAHSSRRTAEACELGVVTLPEARRQGLGLAVTCCWAAAVAAEGRVPLYSALAANAASLALARAAGYRAFARAAHVDA
jgi:hypothetical protein